MNLMLHTLHQHGIIGAGLEEWLEGVGLSESAIEFLTHFFTDTVNLFLIMVVVMFAVSLLQTFVPFEKLQVRMSHLGSVWGYAVAVVLGVASPFCSCTVVPVVMGFLSVGVPMQTALCYLSAAALLNGSALVTLFSSFGMPFGLAYTGLSLVVTVGTSLLIKKVAGPAPLRTGIGGRLAGVHHHDHHHEHCGDEHGCCHNPQTRFGFCLHNVGHVLRDTWLLLLISVALSSALVAFVPLQTLQTMLGPQNMLSPLLAGVVGAPLHADVFAILPLLRILRPINPAAAMAFAIATMGISVPEALLLGKSFRWRAVVAYGLVLAAFSVLVGYLALPLAI